MNKIKKFVAVSVMFGLMAAAAPVFADTTIEDLEAKIAQLEALVAQLQTQLAAPTTPIGVTCTFTRNLYPGVSGADVKCLQETLNAAGYTVATTGAGSPGNETMYYGPRTQAAVKAWQDAVGVSYGSWGGYFGPLSRAKFAAVVVPPATPVDDDEDEDEVVTPGTEGTLSATAAATPPTGETIYVGQTDVAVAGLNVKALGSNIKLSRLDINFTSRPWLNVSTITIVDGTTDVLTYNVTEANTIEVVAGSSYTVRITGLNLTVPDGVTKTLTVKVTPKLVAGGSSATIDYHIPANAFRGTDGVGITQYAPSAALTARAFSIGTATGALALSANSDNPAQRAVIGSSAAVTENVELLRFDVKATINDAIVSVIKTGNLVDAGVVTQTLKLYDGDTLLAATSSVNGAVHSFAPLNLRVKKDETKTLSIKADLKKLTDALSDNAISVNVPADTAGITAHDAGTFSAITSTGAADGKTVRAYTSAPSLALVSASITGRKPANVASNTFMADAKIRFNVTAVNGNIYVGTTTASGITGGSGTAASTSVVNNYASELGTTYAANGYWEVLQGDTKWFEVTSVLTNSTTDVYFTDFRITSFRWGTTTTASYQWTWGLEALQTGAQYLEGKN